MKDKKKFECKNKEDRYISDLVWSCDKCYKKIITPINKETSKLLKTVLKIQSI